MSNWIDLENKYYMQVARRQPIVLVEGQGSYIWDEDGKEYIDFTAGWAVDTLGHCHPDLVNAIQEQAKTLLQTSNQFFTIPQVKLAQILIDNSCLDRVFFSNSGADKLFSSKNFSYFILWKLPFSSLKLLFDRIFSDKEF